MSLGMPHPWWS